MVITIIGILLNLHVFGLYIGNKSIPRSFSNKLLLHQCFVDLVNLVILILPFTCRRLLLLRSYCHKNLAYDEYVKEMGMAFTTFANHLPLSTASSAFTFTLEAVDRLLASISEEMHEKFKEGKVILNILSHYLGHLMGIKYSTVSGSILAYILGLVHVLFGCHDAYQHNINRSRILQIS